MKDKVHIGSDHAGFELKEAIRLHLEKLGLDVTDHGAYEFDEEDDYPDYVIPVCHEITMDPEARGIILGGSGQGEAMVANRFPGVRAVVYYGEPNDNGDLDVIKLSREHNNANVLSLGARFLSEEEAIEAIDLWFETSFSGDERHVRRLGKLSELK